MQNTSLTRAPWTWVLMGCAWLLLGATEIPVAQMDWSRVKETEQIPGQIFPLESNPDQMVLRLQNPQSSPQTFSLWTLDSPALTEGKWRVTGQIRYQDVEEEAYLELLNTFAEGTFFTRSLASRGPLQSIRGSSEWRTFTLSFDATIGDALSVPTPEQLQLALVMPSSGVVEISSIQLWNGVTDPRAWWGDQGGWAGGILGSGMGLMGAVIGILTGMGRGRRIVMILTGLTLAVSGVLLVVGSYALIVGQPYTVFYPLLLVGSIGIGVFGFNLKSIQQRYQQIELRQMQARDTAL